MSAITVAVPVFNGSAYLPGALESIAAQTCGDFEVLIFDNASSDDTASIAAAFAGRDSRFRHIRQPENLGALANYVEALRAAATPYFVWHAIDDRWDDNYLEVLLRELESRPEADLAVATVDCTDLDGRHLRTVVYSPKLDPVVRLFRAHPSWIYGLFRREPLLARVETVWNDYAHPWAWDHLTLFHFIIRDRVAGTQATNFHQLIRRSARVPRQKKRALPNIRVMADLRRRFSEIAQRDIDSLEVSDRKRQILKLLLPLYVGKRVYRWRRLVLRRLLVALAGGRLDVRDEQAGFERYF